ncbi:hypothetical protein HA051_16615 [Chromobacterium vaccinii]|nr:hypothetical protein [Chromobacterium vaccinii]
MSTFKVAHIREQGIDLIITPLNSSFGRQTDQEQQDVIATLQMCASSAGLKGTVVPAWQEGGRVRFIAPTRWHPFFKSINWNYIVQNINRELTCSD